MVPPFVGSKVRVVNVPAAGVVPPITVLSIVPDISPEVMFTLPELLPVKTKSAFDVVQLISLSVIVILLSTTNLDMLTAPVPPGCKIMSALESELIILSLIFKLSISTGPGIVVSVLTVKSPFTVTLLFTANEESKLTAPLIVTAPSITKASLKLIVAESSELKVVPCILIPAITISPVPEADNFKSAFEVVTLISLSVKLIAESTVRLVILTCPEPPGVKIKSAFEEVLIMLSSIEMLSMFVVPSVVVPETLICDSVVKPPVAVKVEPTSKDPDKVVLPDALKVPSVIKFSLKFIVVESADEIEVPLKPTPANTTLPDPDGIILMSSFDLVPSMLLSLIFKPGKTTDPVPDGCRVISAFVSVLVMLF